MDPRVKSRAKSLDKDQKEDSDAPIDQAKQILEESDERVSDHNAGSLGDDSVERRNVEDLVVDHEPE
ncbi:MAG: hypothetical protein ABR507_08840 [Actinomycetota bacterium]|nr:hypothetical protein [Actinomycetota bacterium]